MDQEKTGENIQKGILPGKLHRLRNNIDQRDRQHVPRAQRQKILQKFSRPFLPHHKIAAQQISARGHQPQDRRPPHPHRFLVFHPPTISSLCTLRPTSVPSAIILRPFYPFSARFRSTSRVILPLFSVPKLKT